MPLVQGNGDDTPRRAIKGLANAQAADDALPGRASRGPRKFPMRRALLLVFVLSFILPQGARAATEDYIGFFKNVSGNLKVVRDKTEIIPIAGTRIQRSDVVVSGADSTAGIVFEDGTLLTVGPASEVSIRRYVFEPDVGKYDFALFLRKGSAIYASGKLGKLSPESVSLATPKATVGVRGTRFILKAD